MALPVALGAFASGLALLLPWLITRLLLALGLGYFIYQGMDILMGNIESQIISYFGQLPADIYNIILMCGAGEAITILLSALSTKILLMGFQGGSKAMLGYKVT